VARVHDRIGEGRSGGSSIRTMLTEVAAAGPATRLVARRGQKHYFVRVADIDWIEAEGNYLRLVTGDTSHLIRDTMKGVESRLDPRQFVRVHRSAIVAIDRIRSIEAREHGDYVITMASGGRIETSRGYSERVRALLR
jgi:two-component system LytT family response regulator